MKAEGLLDDLRSLPALATAQDSRVPALDHSDDVSSDSDELPTTPHADKTLPPLEKSSRGKQLWQELAYAQASSKVVDLTKYKPGKVWQPLKHLPEVQIHEKKQRHLRLARQAEQYLEQAR